MDAYNVLATDLASPIATRRELALSLLDSHPGFSRGLSRDLVSAVARITTIEDAVSLKGVIQSIASSRALHAADAISVMTALSAAVADGNRSGRLPFTFEHNLDEFPVLADAAAQALIFGRSLVHVRTQRCNASRAMIHRTAHYARAKGLREFAELHGILGGVVRFGSGLSLMVDDIESSRSGRGVTLFGRIENASPYTWQSLTIGLDVVANNGALHGGTLFFPELKPGSLDLGAEARGADLAIGPLLAHGSCAVASIRSVGIIKDYRVTYRLSMVEPVVRSNLSYLDTDLLVRFEFQEEQIQLLLENKTDQVVMIDWNSTSYVDPSALAHRVIHEGVRIADRSTHQGPTAVPPGARIIDVIVPADYISRDGTSWKARPLFPRGPAAEGLRGAEVRVYLSLTIRGKAKPYNFRFRVDDVVPTITRTSSSIQFDVVPWGEDAV